MTIVAGFRVQDGVLLCADTMYSGLMKIHQQKIFPVTFADAEPKEHFAFALSGSEAYGKMAIDECTEALHDLGSKGRTLRNVKSTLRKTIKHINDSYIYSRPEHERTSLEFQFVIAAFLPKGGGAQLFSTQGSAVNLEADYACIGTGDYLGHYLIRPIFSRMLNMNGVALLATQVLAAAKSYDVNCGGLSTLTIITSQGELKPLFDYPFYAIETFASQYDNFTRSLLFQVTDSGLADEAFERSLNMFSDSIKRMRESWKRSADMYERATRPSAPVD